MPVDPGLGTGLRYCSSCEEEFRGGTVAVAACCRGRERKQAHLGERSGSTRGCETSNGLDGCDANKEAKKRVSTVLTLNTYRSDYAMEGETIAAEGGSDKKGNFECLSFSPSQFLELGQDSVQVCNVCSSCKKRKGGRRDTERVEEEGGSRRGRQRRGSRHVGPNLASCFSRGRRAGPKKRWRQAVE